MVSYRDEARQVFEIEAKELKHVASLLDESFDKAIDILYTCLKKKGKIIVLGIGKSGDIGKKIVATFNSTGAPSVLLNAQNALHGDLGIVTQGDVIITFSYSGETEELINLLPYIKRISDISLVGITGNKESHLAQHSDIFLNVNIEREACPLNLAPTSSTTAMLAMGDALAMVLLKARGFSEKDFANFHPKGNLGKILLTKASDIMRKENEIAMLKKENTVNDALVLMSERRAGSCLIIDNDKKLLGVFTHGDFVRAFQQNPHLAQTTLECHMSINPFCIKENMLAVEAAKLIEVNRVDEIIVTNKESQPVGVIDSQDFTLHKIV